MLGQKKFESTSLYPVALISGFAKLMFFLWLCSCKAIWFTSAWAWSLKWKALDNCYHFEENVSLVKKERGGWGGRGEEEYDARGSPHLASISLKMFSKGHHPFKCTVRISYTVRYMWYVLNRAQVPIVHPFEAYDPMLFSSFKWLCSDCQNWFWNICVFFSKITDCVQKHMPVTSTYRTICSSTCL